MKVLVIEDNPTHQASADVTLEGHDLTVLPSFDQGMAAIKAMSNGGEKYEAVLVDMMMPMGDREKLVSEAYSPREQVPYGFVLALVAAQHGAQYIAMLTDTNHHKSAMSAALDHFECPEYGNAAYYRGGETLLQINGAKALFVHAPFVGKSQAKDWARVLKHLVDGPTKME